MQKTDLNTSPYYDDFDENKDFHRVLFRPGFSVQARELTQLQSILQKQIGNFGKHFFKDGTVVIPGQAAYSGLVYGVKINLDSLASEDQSTLISAYQTALAAGDVVIQDQDPNDFVNEDTVIRANIIHIEEPTADDPLILYLKYVKAGGASNDQSEFSDNTVLYATPSSGTLGNVLAATTGASIKGSIASIEKGVYFIREHFVRVAEQKIVLEKYSFTPSARVGLTITEDVVTPEEDTSLLDNAQGTTNFNAKGAHRLKISLILTKKDLGSTDDENFVELLSVKNGNLQSKARPTEYSVLGETLARRTFDESGNYLVKPFSFELRQNLDDGFNNGLYQTGQTTDDGNAASEDLFNVVVSPGKGYVNGYETELIGKTFIDIEKARDVEVVDGVSSSIEVGNYILVTNTHGSPTLTLSGQTHVPYTEINLHDSLTNSKLGGNAATGTESSSFATADNGLIGVARVRGFEKESGNYDGTDDFLESDSQHKLYLFDIQMVTELTLSGQMKDDTGLSAGDKVIGTSSKATGIVQRVADVTVDATTLSYVYIIAKTGTFTSSDTLKTTGDSSGNTTVNNIVVNSSDTELTVSSSKEFSINQVKSVFGQNQSISSNTPSDITNDVFTADVISTLTTSDANQNTTNVDRTTLTGTVFPVFSVGSRNSLTGTGTKFLTELVVGDILEVATGSNGASEFIQIDEITSDTDANFFVVSGDTDTATITSSTGYYVFFGSLTASENGLLNVYPAGVNYYRLTENKQSIPATRIRTKVVDQNKNVLVRKLKKNFIKELDETELEYKVRKTYYVTVASDTQQIGTLTGDDVFEDVSELDYQLTVYELGTSPQVSVGQNFDVRKYLQVVGTNTLQLKGSLTSKIGTGTGKIKVVATIRKEQSGRKAKTIQKSQLLLIEDTNFAANYGVSTKHTEISLGFADVFKVHAVYEGPGDGTTPTLPQWSVTSIASPFTVGETIKGSTSNALGIVLRSTSSGSPILVFVPTTDTAFQSGETITGLTSGITAVLDTLTDTNSTNIKSNFFFDDGQRDNYYDVGKLVRKPNKPVPNGKLLVVLDYFTHGSGNFFSVDSYTNQIDYDQIPTYSANRVDPDEPEPAGEFELGDSIDYRPRVSDRSFSSGLTINGITYNSLIDYTFGFSNRLFYDSAHNKTGASTNDLFKDGTNFRYGFSRYLSRIDSLFLTPNGNILKVVGTPAEVPLQPRRIENSMHLANINIPAYTFSLDSVFVKRIDHDRYTMKDIAGIDKRMTNFEYYTALNLLEKQTADLEVVDANGFNKFKSGFLVDNFKGHGVGDVAHPDYNNSIDFQEKELRPRFSVKNLKLDEVATTTAERTSAGYQKTGDFITLPYTHVVSVQQPYASTVEKVNPVLTFNWVGSVKLTPSRDDWFEVGKVEKRVLEVEEGDYDHLLKQQGGPKPTYQWNSWETIWSGKKVKDSSITPLAGRRGSLVRTTIQDIDKQVRAGIERRVVVRIDERQVGEDKIINETPILYMRSTDEMGAEIQFTATGLKPKTKVYPFFDKISITSLITPDGGSRGDALITDAGGSVTGTFQIPDPKTEGVLRFETGEKVFRLTSSSTNENSNTIDTFADGKFISSGILRDVGRDIIQTKNGEIAINAVTEKRDYVAREHKYKVEIGCIYFDPLAQSFATTSAEGEYITKIDVYFATKDDQNIPVTLQVREMQNGYPTTKILPLGKVTLSPSSVNTSTDASVATTFTFESPIYLKGGNEYCFVLISASNKYTAWISRVGETDIGGTRFISEQPYLGVLFKSQNNTTWVPSQLEDLKFTIYRAQFDTSAKGELLFHNASVPNKKLNNNPMECFNGSETFTGDGSTTVFTLSKTLSDYNITSSELSYLLVDEDGVVKAPASYTNGQITFSSPPADESTITVRYLFNKIKVYHEDHHMYQSSVQNTSGTKDNYVVFTDVAGDRTDSILTIDSISADSQTTAGDPEPLKQNTSYIVPSLEPNTTALFKVSSNNSGNVDTIEVLNPGSGFSVGTANLTLDFSGITSTDSNPNSVTKVVGIDIDSIGDTLFGVPISVLNGTSGFKIKDFGMDYYTIEEGTGTGEVNLSPYIISNFTGEKLAGGSSVTASENVQFNTLKLSIPTIEHNDTLIETSIRSTSGLSPGIFADSITQESFVTSSNYTNISLDEASDYLSPKLIASPINQDSNLSSKSLFVKLSLTSNTEFLSPIVDLDVKSVVAVANRFSNIDSSANVYPRSSYISPTESEGDSGETIYITRKVQLETPARSIKVYFDGLRQATSEFQVLYKILHSDDTTPFDELGWAFFNNGSTSGTNSDVTVNANENYVEYTFEDDDLDEFIAFSIKIRMQGTNTSEVPKIKNLRVLALAT